MGSIPGSGRCPGAGNSNLLQYPCLEKLMDKGAWQATVHGVAKSWTRLSNKAQHMHHFFKKKKQHERKGMRSSMQRQKECLPVG